MTEKGARDALLELCKEQFMEGRKAAIYSLVKGIEESGAKSITIEELKAMAIIVFGVEV